MPENKSGRADARAVVGQVVGLAEDAARRHVVTAGCIFRIVWRDSVEPGLSMDSRADRLNVSIQDGVVVAARVG